jgi:hypothetical protein
MNETCCPDCLSTRIQVLGSFYFKAAPPLPYQWGCEHCGCVFFLSSTDRLGRPSYTVYEAGHDWRQYRYTCVKFGLDRVDKGIVWTNMNYQLQGRRRE